MEPKSNETLQSAAGKGGDLGAESDGDGNIAGLILFWFSPLNDLKPVRVLQIVLKPVHDYPMRVITFQKSTNGLDGLLTAGSPQRPGHPQRSSEGDQDTSTYTNQDASPRTAVFLVSVIAPRKR